MNTALQLGRIDPQQDLAQAPESTHDTGTNPFDDFLDQAVTNIPSGSNSNSAVDENRPFTLDEFFNFYNSAKESDYAFNSAEAQKNREWQEYMSNTAYQRQVNDLLAAGLNPWLAVQNGGSGAAVGSGSAASSNAAVSSAGLYQDQIANRTTNTVGMLKILGNLVNTAANYFQKSNTNFSIGLSGILNFLGKIF